MTGQHVPQRLIPQPVRVRVARRLAVEGVEPPGGRQDQRAQRGEEEGASGLLLLPWLLLLRLGGVVGRPGGVVGDDLGWMDGLTPPR